MKNEGKSSEMEKSMPPMWLESKGGEARKRGVGKREGVRGWK